jgi:subtilisin family serine protease
MPGYRFQRKEMRKSALLRLFLTALLIAALAPVTLAEAAERAPFRSKLGPVLRARAARAAGWSRIIFRASDGPSLAKMAVLVHAAGGRLGRSLPLIQGRVALVPNAALAALADSAFAEQVVLDRPVKGVSERTGATIGSTAIRQELGLDGTGVGVAVIDSGVTSWHDDLADSGGQRVYHFVDFVNGVSTPYDDYGHGTHVAGVVAGNGFDSAGARSGIAPGAHLVVLKVLDGQGRGSISDVIAAIDYVIAHKDELQIRVINLSVSAAVHESYDTDPLTLAARRAVEAGIVVVAAAGNFGHDPEGRLEYGGVTAPANAPWVLTVGASSHMGTADRSDDKVATFSSRGPTAIDNAAKPDVLAPGVGIESLSSPDSAFYVNKAEYLLEGTVATAYLPYLSLSGTSVAAPVVSGTVALMLQANPMLTPNAVKAILQYTAQAYPGSDSLTQGAGFLNAKGAVELAHFFADPSSVAYPSSSDWSAHLIWGNRRLGGGRLVMSANAWSTEVTWGTALTPGSQPVEWGTLCTEGVCDGDAPAVWAATCADALCSTMTWGAGESQNVVWGTLCGGENCQGTWSVGNVGDAVVGTNAADTVVWGSDDAETVVWGSSDSDTVVWGSRERGDTVVWGSRCTNSACDLTWDVTPFPVPPTEPIVPVPSQEQPASEPPSPESVAPEAAAPESPAPESPVSSVNEPSAPEAGATEP